MNKKIFISDNNEIGLECKHWASKNLIDGYEITDKIQECDIFISILYDKLLEKDFIKTRDCYNFHPAILPDYAGVGTLTWSILNNEESHGITLHLIDEGIDTGDIIDIIKFKIDKNETSYSLHKKTMKKMVVFFKKKLYILIQKKFKATKQNFKNRKLYKYEDLNNLLDLSKYVRATYFPDKQNPFYYNRQLKKIEINYE